MTFKQVLKDYPGPKNSIFRLISFYDKLTGGFDTKFSRTRSHHTRILEVSWDQKIPKILEWIVWNRSMSAKIDGLVLKIALMI